MKMYIERNLTITCRVVYIIMLVRLIQSKADLTLTIKKQVLQLI